ncbi:hypothetical protein ACIOWK_27355 [Pseudomonas protegens]|uniref:hypothetical protein n=1 Tax=Pseudomonas protegens TaxID=380021 RepID=UPI0037FC49A5
MSNEMISVPRHDLALALGNQEEGVTPYLQKRASDRLRALLAKPAEQHQATLTVKRYDQDSVTGHSDVEVALPGIIHFDHGPNLAEALARLASRVARFHKLEAPSLSTKHQGEPMAVMYADGSVLTKAECGIAFDICCKVETPLYTRPAAQPQCEPVAYRCRHSENEPWFFSDKPGYWECQPLYTRPAEQTAPISSSSDKYKAELYDEVWQLARGMGFGNVTDALMKLQSQLQGEPPSYKPGLYAVRHIDNWDGEGDVVLTFANLGTDGKWTNTETGDALMAYRGDKILRAWPLDCSDAPGTQIIGVPRAWLEDWALELVEAAQDGGQMSNQIEHLLEVHAKP